MKYFILLKKTPFSKPFTTKNNAVKSTIEEFLDLLNNQDKMIIAIKEMKNNIKYRHLFRDAYPHIDFDDKVKTTEFLLHQNKLVSSIYNENVALIKNEENFFDPININKLSCIINYLEKFNEKTVKIDLIKSLYNNVSKGVLSKLQMNDYHHLKFIISCLSLEASFNHDYKIAFSPSTNFFYKSLVELLLSDLKNNRLPDNHLIKLFFALDRNKYSNDEVNDYLIDIVLKTDMKRLNFFIVLFLIHNNSIIKSKRLNEFIEKLKDFDIFETRKNTDEIAVFFRILCFLLSQNKGNEVLIERTSSFMKNPISNNIFSVKNLNRDEKNKYIDLLFPLLYLHSSKCFIHDTNMENNISLLINQYSLHRYHSNHTITMFHRDVLTTLIQMQLDYEVENREDYLSKDIVINSKIRKNEKLCIELLGQHHYYRDGTKNFKTEYKNKILKLNGWTVIEISHLEWLRLNEDCKVPFIKNLLKI